MNVRVSMSACVCVCELMLRGNLGFGGQDQVLLVVGRNFFAGEEVSNAASASLMPQLQKTW